MKERVDQRCCIKFCQKLGDSQAETIRKIRQVFGVDAIGETQIKEWFNRFKNGRISVESDQRPGRPQTARSAAVVAKVQNLIRKDRHFTVREIADEVGISKDSAHAIIREQKQLRLDVAQGMLDTANTPNTDPKFHNTVITRDDRSRERKRSRRSRDKRDPSLATDGSLEDSRPGESKSGDRERGDSKKYHREKDRDCDRDKDCKDKNYERPEDPEVRIKLEPLDDYPDYSGPNYGDEGNYGDAPIKYERDAGENFGVEEGVRRDDRVGVGESGRGVNGRQFNEYEDDQY